VVVVPILRLLNTPNNLVYFALTMKTISAPATSAAEERFDHVIATIRKDQLLPTTKTGDSDKALFYQTLMEGNVSEAASLA